MNHALGGQYPPGSTFKMVTCRALQERVVTAQQRINCPGSLYAGTGSTDWKEEGHGNVARARPWCPPCDIYF